MTHILLPTDFSDDSLNACRYAIELFGTEGNEFVLLHSYLDPIPNNTVWAGVSAELYKACEEGMDTFHRNFRSLKGGDVAVVRTELKYGPLSVVVGDMINEMTVDVVVMGTQGKTGVTFLGTNASELAKQCKVPVLIVPKDAQFRGLRRILLADDHKGVEPLAMRWLVKLAKRYVAHISIGHVLQNAGEKPDPLIVKEYDTALVHVEHTFIGVPGDDVALALSNVAERDEVDMVVVLHRHMGILDGLFHRSVAKRLAVHVKMPLLVLQH